MSLLLSEFTFSLLKMFQFYILLVRCKEMYIKVKGHPSSRHCNVCFPERCLSKLPLKAQQMSDGGGRGCLRLCVFVCVSALTRLGVKCDISEWYIWQGIREAIP